jgi:phosphoheptose isomerase
MGRGGGRVSGAKRTQLASGNAIEIAHSPNRNFPSYACSHGTDSLDSGLLMSDFRQTMSIQESLNDSIAAIRSVSNLESQILQAADLLLETLIQGRKVLVCGNGGSASDSAHLATEIACRFLIDRRPYPAISLSSEGGLMTAIGNDYSFDEIFSRQVEGFGQPGDLLIAFTTSGKSKNVTLALKTARKSGLKTIAFLGRDGGECKGIADIELLVSHPVTAKIQEAHKVIIHLLCELVEPQLLS